MRVPKSPAACCGDLYPLATIPVAVFRFFSRWGESLGEVPGERAGGEPAGGLLFRAQTCRLARDFFLGLGVWVTPLVTLVVQSVLAGVGFATAHVLIGDLTAPGNNHIV